MDGTFEVWDTMFKVLLKLIFKQNEPTLTVQVSQSPIHSIKVQDHGKHVAVSSRDGSMTVFELSDGLSKLQPDEKNAFSIVTRIV